jgi:hypothetical protein
MMNHVTQRLAASAKLSSVSAQSRAGALPAMLRAAPIARRTLSTVPTQPRTRALPAVQEAAIGPVMPWSAHARAPRVSARATAATLRAMLLIVATALLVSPALVSAQGAPPARETPRPQDVDPGVNTSAPSQAPTRDTAAPVRDSRPEDIDPAVNTSAAAPANEDAGASSSTPAGAAGGGASARATGSGAANPSSTERAASTKPAVGPDGKPVRGKALDRLELDTTQITGNRELPKVLYIVPWKRSDLGDLTGKPVNSLVDEVLTPVDRDVFKRENRYYRALENAPANGTTAPSSGASPAGASESGNATPAARDER